MYAIDAMNGRTHRRIVINDEHRGCLRSSCTCLDDGGQGDVRTCAARDWSAAPKRPPCDSMIERLMRNPMPLSSNQALIVAARRNSGTEALCK